MDSQEFDRTVEKLYIETDPESVTFLSLKLIDLIEALPEVYQSRFASLLSSEQLPEANLEELVSMIYDYDYIVQNLEVQKALEKCILHSKETIALTATFSVYYCCAEGPGIVWELLTNKFFKNKKQVFSLFWYLSLSTENLFEVLN